MSESTQAAGSAGPDAAERAKRIFDADRLRLMVRVDRLFGGLMIFQFLAAVIVAFTVSPRTWTGAYGSLHPHVWAAVFLGGLIAAFPCVLVQLRPGQVFTRHVVAVSQMLMGALLIHLTGGRIETHFHVFGSLAFLAFYRDWPVMVSATVVVAADHFLRGVFWPQSVFGVLTASQWRWIEHAGWVVFIDLFLVTACVRGAREMRNAAQRMAELESINRVIEAKVDERTAELARHREHLEELVTERTSELQEALDKVRVTNVELEQANLHKNRFLSTMSHELRTPLNAIIGFTDLLYSEGFGPLNDKQKEYVKRVETGGEHLLSLINDVLDVAKIDAGTMELNVEAFDLDEAVRGTMKMLSSQLQAKDLELRIEAEAGAVLADRRKFRQILINLVGNAVKYSPQGGTITVEGRAVSEHETAITVRDTGVGIAADQLEKIFDEFHQADRRRDEALGGIGLGLALTRRLVELHGGTISVASEPGKGAAFTVVMPRPRQDAPAADIVAEEHAPEPSRDEGRLILVAEDNEANLSMLEGMLSMKRHRIVIAHNGRECIDLALKHRPDMILTDVRMPVMDGLEATRALRAMQEFKDLPIIALTANASAVSEQECIEAGCNAHMTKPVKMQKLFAALDAYLNPSTAPAVSAP